MKIPTLKHMTKEIYDRIFNNKVEITKYLRSKRELFSLGEEILKDQLIKRGFLFLICSECNKTITIPRYYKTVPCVCGTNNFYIRLNDPYSLPDKTDMGTTNEVIESCVNQVIIEHKFLKLSKPGESEG